ncbi:MAG: hypothetical protein AAFV43_07430 [Planctomycetota bacterium]
MIRPHHDLAAVLIALAVCSVATAEIETVRFTEVDNGGVSDEFLDLAGTRTTDLFIDFSGDLGGQQLLVELEAGRMINHPLGDPQGDAPSEALKLVSPTAAFDTSLSATGPGESTQDGWLVFGGAASLQGGVGAVEFSETRLSVAFAPPIGQTIAGQADFPVLRLTLSDDAEGTFTYLGDTSAPAPPQVFAFPIVAGEVRQPIDEPESGDFNGDGRVDNNDLNLLLNNWGRVTLNAAWTRPVTVPVDNDELNALLNDWGAGLTPVPEPSATLAALTLLAINHLRPLHRR